MKIAELNTKQINFELDEDEIEMLQELIKLESARKGRINRSRFGGLMLREKHCQSFPHKWDEDGNYIPRLTKLEKMMTA